MEFALDSKKKKLKGLKIIFFHHFIKKFQKLCFPTMKLIIQNCYDKFNGQTFPQLTPYILDEVVLPIVWLN